MNVRVACFGSNRLQRGHRKDCNLINIDQVAFAKIEVLVSRQSNQQNTFGLFAAVRSVHARM